RLRLMLILQGVSQKSVLAPSSAEALERSSPRPPRAARILRRALRCANAFRPSQQSPPTNLSDGRSDLGGGLEWAEVVQAGQQGRAGVGQHAGQNLHVLTEPWSGLAAMEQQHGGGDL